MNRSIRGLPKAIGATILLAGLGYWALPYIKGPTPESLVSAPRPPAPELPPAAAPPEPATPELAAPPAIENPIDAGATTHAADAAPVLLPGLNASDALVSEQLTALLGRKGVLSFVQLDGFIRRVVATVDNLARSQASSKLWPVYPTAQRFTTQKNSGGSETIHPDNGKRYAPLVHLVESVDMAKAVAVYRAFYPLFQQAYEELGFPNGYFNDRLVQVLDHLIATPLPTGPMAVKLLEVKGTVPSLRPWVRYEYADPELEALSAGRKMLLRSGPDNLQRLITQLKALRQSVAKPS